MNTLKLCLGTARHSEVTTVPASVQLLILSLLECTKHYQNFSLNMAFYTVHPFSNTDRNRLFTDNCVLFIYVTNFADRQTGSPKVWPYLYNGDVHRGR